MSKDDARKVAAMNLMLTSVNPTVRKIAELHLDQHDAVVDFTEMLRRIPASEGKEPK